MLMLAGNQKLTILGSFSRNGVQRPTKLRTILAVYSGISGKDVRMNGYSHVTIMTCSMVFWGMTTCSLLDGHQRFGGTYCVYLQVAWTAFQTTELDCKNIYIFLWKGE
jgi:hypothetical protein